MGRAQLYQGRRERFAIGIPEMTRLKACIMQPWTKNQKSASLVVPGWFFEYLKASEKVGMVRTTVLMNNSHRRMVIH